MPPYEDPMTPYRSAPDGVRVEPTSVHVRRDLMLSEGYRPVQGRYHISLMALVSRGKILAVILGIIDHLPEVSIVTCGAHHMAGLRDPNANDFSRTQRVLASDTTLLRSALHTHMQWLLEDGHAAVRFVPRTNEQSVVLDDHKCLVTPDSPDYRALFSEYGIPLRGEMLILPDLPHEHNIFVGGAAEMQRFLETIAPWDVAEEE